MAFVGSLLSALAAIPKIAEYVEKFCSEVVIWYVNTKNSETLAKLADAASAGAHAQNKEERYAALEKWRAALGSPKHTP